MNEIVLKMIVDTINLGKVLAMVHVWQQGKVVVVLLLHNKNFDKNNEDYPMAKRRKDFDDMQVLVVFVYKQ
jgi:hypothetical protein